MIIYIIILAILFILELVYFRIATHYNIIDKPNERSSHKRIVLRGGGIIFTVALWMWSFVYGFDYPWLLAGVTLAAGVSLVDDIHSLPDSLRLFVQFLGMFLVFAEIGLIPSVDVLRQAQEPSTYAALEPIEGLFPWVMLPFALIVAVGCTNIFNFMDGINGITGGYALAIVIPLILLNRKYEFMEVSLLVVIGLSLLVFSFFNFRTKAKCFAGDVGSIGMALILVFCIGRLIIVTGDVTWIVLYLLYGVDGVLTICHRIMLHENLGQAHRKHVFQLMANELKMKHMVVSGIYMVLQLIVSLVAIYVIPDTLVVHWIYLVVMAVLFSSAYILFKMKYYHLHEEYLLSLKK